MLPVRLGGRHAGCGGYRALPAGDVRDPERGAADDAGGRGDVPGAVLQQQGPVKVRTFHIHTHTQEERERERERVGSWETGDGYGDGQNADVDDVALD